MPASKRVRQINDIVSLLGALQSCVQGPDYDEICRLLSIYDRTENQITREQKRAMSKAMLYAKTSHLIFTNLCNISLTSHRVVSTLQRIEEVVEASKRIPNQVLLSESISSIKRKSQSDREIQQQKIIHDCSQLQISIRIQTMSRIVQVGRSCGPAVESVGERCSLLENIIPDYVLQSRLYATLRNCCLLGAVVAHTQVQTEQMRVSLSKIVLPIHPRPILNCGDLERAEAAIYEMIEKTKKAKSIRRQNNKLRKQAMEKLQIDFVTLSNELVSANAKLVDTKNTIKTQQIQDELVAVDFNKE